MRKLWNQYSYAIILFVLSCSVAMMISCHFKSDDQDKFVKLTVSEGDSLWKISDQFSGQHSLSNEEFVNWVKSHNKLEDDHIFPGEEIVIPVPKKASTATEFASAAGE
jgi:LysM repeat protein